MKWILVGYVNIAFLLLLLLQRVLHGRHGNVGSDTAGSTVTTACVHKTLLLLLHRRDLMLEKRLLLCTASRQAWHDRKRRRRRK